MFLIKFIGENNDSQQYVDEKIDKIAIANFFRQMKVLGMISHVFNTFSSGLHVNTPTALSFSINSKSPLRSINFCFNIELDWKSINYISISSKSSHFKLSKFSASSDVESGCKINCVVSANCLNCVNLESNFLINS